MSEEKTEQATAQRKKKARDGGDRVRSRELLSGAALLAGLLTLGATGGELVQAWRGSYTAALQLASNLRGSAWNADCVHQAVKVVVLPMVKPVGLTFAATFFAVGTLGFAQSGGFSFNAQALAPKGERLSPLANAKQMFSARTLVRLAKSIVPAALVAWLGWGVVQHAVHDVPVMSLQRLPQTFEAAYTLCVRAAWITVTWSGIDYVVEWRAWNKRLKMSKQDIRQEIKEQAGNPQVKGKLRQMQRAMRRRKAKVDMRRATVVITNPTHYAVALEFSFETMQAPTVLGKGRDLHALDMREEARWASVAIIENPPLARSLYRSVEVGQSIPFELYAAIAGILAFLYREQNEAAAREARTSAAASEQRHAPAPAVGSMLGFEGGI